MRELLSDRSWDTSDLDVGTEVAVRGKLRGSGLQGVLLMTRKPRCWEQRGRWTTAHMNRDYVCGEGLSCIFKTWIASDFHVANASILYDADEKAALWAPFENGELPWKCGPSVA